MTTISSNVDDIRMSYYSDATNITQQFLNNTFSAGESQLEAICTITKDLNVIRVSNIPKFVGDTWYEGRAKLPILKRTLGEFLSSTFQFSDTSIEVSNVDGFYNKYFIGGTNYSTFIGASIVFQFGIRDVQSSYTTLYSGIVKNQAGTSKSLDTINFNVQESFSLYNANLNLPMINITTFPSAPQDSLGKLIPICIGDWTAGFTVIDAADVNVRDSGSDVAALNSAPQNFYGGLKGYYVGGGYFIFATGNYIPDTISDARLQRGNDLLKINFNSTAQIVNGYYAISVTSIKKSGGGTIGYTYQQGDIVLVSVKIPYSVGKYDNLVEQAQRILIDFLGISSTLFDSSWATLAAKNTPTQSAIASIKSRVWIGNNNITILEYVTSLLQQIRIQMFFNKTQMIQLRSLHFDDFPAVSSMRIIDNFQIVENSIKIELNDKTYMSGASGNYGFAPVTEKTMLNVPLITNIISQNATNNIVQKTIDFPNLYVATDVTNQLAEYIRLFSFPLEYIYLSTAWTGLLDELGNFINLNYNFANISYDNAPCMIRDIEIDMDNGMINYKLLNFYGFNYPNYTSGFSNMLSSYNATIA